MLVANQRPENEEPKNRYDNDKCNIGTNFKTGVSIKKEKHAFIIIMPPRSTKMWFRNKSGIFSDGVNSIIQALARQRKPGEIHIILSKPDKFDYNSLSKAGFTQEQIDIFSKNYNSIQHYAEEPNKVEYYSLQEQDNILYKFYNHVLKAYVIKEIEYISELDREKLPRLKYPTYELFKLGKGEEYLANTIKFYGEDLSAYITFCAFTNQFINCNLSGLNNKIISLFFEKGKVQKQLIYYFIKYFGGVEGGHAFWMDWRNFHKVYLCFREDLFKNFNLKYRKDETSKYKKLKPFELYFEIQLLKFIESMCYGFNFKNEDIEYSRGDYFLDCISISQRINVEENNYIKEYKNKIKFYQILGYFRDKIINSTKHYTYDKLSYDYLDNNMPDNWFSAKDEMMFDTLLRLLPNDELLLNDVFIFKRNLNKNSFYKRLI